MSTADDLQAKLDEIAAAGTYTQSQPDTIRIPESGIVIDKQLYLKEKCHAVLTGGDISFAENLQTYSPFYSKEKSSLTFKNIYIDHSKGYMHYLVSLYGGGSVIFDENVEFADKGVNNDMGLCHLDKESSVTYKSGTYYTNGIAIDGEGYVNMYGGTIESANTAIIGDDVWFRGPATVIGGNVVIDCNIFGFGEDATVKSTKANAYLVKMNASAEMHRGNFVGEGAKLLIREYLSFGSSDKMPILELGNTATMSYWASTGVYSAIKTLNTSIDEAERTKALIYLSHHKETIISNWGERELNKDIITGITEDEFKYLFEFRNMPDSLEMYYNKENKSAQLRKEYDDLQKWLDDHGDGDRGTEENPIDIPIADSTSVENDIPFDDLQAVLDGSDGEDGTKTITFDGGDINIGVLSKITFINIVFTGTDRGGRINVSGTLIIDININIINIIRFINVLPGGRVIWRGGGGSCGETVIYINPGGHVEYGGGDYSGGNYGFHNYGGTIYFSGGTIHGGWGGGYTNSGGTTYISGGTISGGYINWGHTTITGGTIIGTVSTGDGSGIWHVHNGAGGTIIISGGNIGGNGSTGGVVGNGGNIYLDGGTHGITDIYVIRDGKIYINFDLTVLLRIHINITDIILNTPIILGYDGYRLTEDCLKNIELILPDGYTWRYDEESGGIIIVKITVVISNHDDLQDFLNGLGDNRGTEEEPVEIPLADEFVLGGDVNFDDLQAFLDGLKGDGGRKTFIFDGGDLNINKGTTLTIRNFDFDATDKGGCINVSGTLIVDINVNIIRIIRFINVLEGGRVIWRGGNGSHAEIVINGGDFYFDGGTHGITDIYVIRNGKIYINFNLTVLLRININITDIVLNTPIILGYDGYRLTEDCLKNIEIILPEGYTWKHDEVSGGIIIVASPTGINGITSDADIESVYDTNGQAQGNLQKGVNIIRRKDGTVKKVLVK